MSDVDVVEREVEVDADADEVWRAVTEPGWLGDDLEIDLEPGGDVAVTDPEDGPRTGWVEEAEPGRRLAIWWTADGDEEPSRVEFDITEREEGISTVRVIESRPFADLDIQRATWGPTMALATA